MRRDQHAVAQRRQEGEVSSESYTYRAITKEMGPAAWSRTEPFNHSQEVAFGVSASQPSVWGKGEEGGGERSQSL